jgi:malonyl CoA-acyl carrier protein transacylase
LVNGLSLGAAAALALAANEDFDLTAHLTLLLRCGALFSLSRLTETQP